MKLKRLFKLCQQISKSKKFLQSDKRLSLLTNSNNSQILSTILKEKFKLLIDMNKKKFQFIQQLKRSLKFLKFWKRLSRELLLCHKLLKFLNMSMKSTKMMDSELHWLVTSKLLNSDTDNCMEMLRNNWKFFWLN